MSLGDLSSIGSVRSGTLMPVYSSSWHDHLRSKAKRSFLFPCVSQMGGCVSTLSGTVCMLYLCTETVAGTLTTTLRNGNC